MGEPSSETKLLFSGSQDSLLLYGFCLLSAHMPHSDYAEEDYEAALLDLEDVVSAARQQRRMNIVGVDANAIVGKRCSADDERIVGDYGHGARSKRGFTFVSWLHGQRLAVVSTQKPKPWQNVWTHELWRGGDRRQIDYILTDEIRIDDVLDTYTTDVLGGKSDHRATGATLELFKMRSCRTRRGRIQRGWKPKLENDGTPADFHSALDLVVASFQGAGVDIVELVVSAASESGGATSNSSKRHSDEFQSLVKARRETQDLNEKKDLSKQLWKALRQ